MNGRLLFVHAHPDDESSKGAATAARYVDAGARVALVTCTGGEAGEVLNPTCGPVSPADMSATRARELAAACQVIGFSVHYDLGYVDSGFHEDPAGIPPDAFARQPVDRPGADLATIIRHERPHVVVTYPQDGGYPHPDHVMCHEVTVRALELAEDPDADVAGAPCRVPKVYACHAFPPQRVLALHGALLERGADSPFEGWMERLAQRRSWPCDAKIRVDAWFQRRDDALRAHRTQVDPGGTWFAWPRDLERAIYPWECFTRLRSDVSTSDCEDDLLTGLDVTGDSHDQPASAVAE
ncbi:MAG: mycothiol conjugate amidase Mca [Actinobacteria bacterium]|nr:mycothiol conjugate amidase Mca [Actinomycetota bacterium]